jgi:hypothetical protein
MLHVFPKARGLLLARLGKVLPGRLPWAIRHSSYLSAGLGKAERHAYDLGTGRMGPGQGPPGGGC